MIKATLIGSILFPNRIMKQEKKPNKSVGNLSEKKKQSQKKIPKWKDFGEYRSKSENNN